MSCERSYGSASVILKRGPQLVQFVKGTGSADCMSRRSRVHSGQIAMSGNTSAVLAPPGSLWRMTKSRYPTGSSHDVSKLWIKLRGGLSFSMRRMNVWTCCRLPSSSTKTPWHELFTHPASPSSFASRKTLGRKPTPWTAPRIVSRARVSVPSRI